jgi:hypothetical protein
MCSSKPARSTLTPASPGELDREAVGVVEPERRLAGQGAQPVRLRLGQGLVEHGQPGAQGPVEAHLLAF